jgi:hypothetical protein
MTVVRGTVILALALALCGAGCGGIGGVYLIGEVIHWNKPGFTQAQLSIDWYECRRENTNTDNAINPMNTKACMAARGYSYTERGI